MAMKNENWLPIKDYEGFYEISDHGRVRSLARVIIRSNGCAQSIRACIRKTPLNKVSRYPTVMLCIRGIRTPQTVHSLVAAAFIGPRPPGKEVAHRDGDPTNARLENLRYATPKENDADKIMHGTRPRGMRNGRAKFTDEQIREIRRARLSGEKYATIAERYNVAEATPRKIASRKRWNHVI